MEFHFRFNISCGVAVKVTSHQEKFQVFFLQGVEGDKKKFGWEDTGTGLKGGGGGNVR